MSEFRDKIKAHHQALITKAQHAIVDVANDQNVLLGTILDDLGDLMSFIENYMYELDDEGNSEDDQP